MAPRLNTRVRTSSTILATFAPVGHGRLGHDHDQWREGRGHIPMDQTNGSPKRTKLPAYELEPRQRRVYVTACPVRELVFRFFAQTRQGAPHAPSQPHPG
eukprot:2722273-Pyramimonas_sp.AAC.1